MPRWSRRFSAQLSTDKDSDHEVRTTRVSGWSQGSTIAIERLIHPLTSSCETSSASSPGYCCDCDPKYISALILTQFQLGETRLSD
jgi:hypothetical protein